MKHINALLAFLALATLAPAVWAAPGPAPKSGEAAAQASPGAAPQSPTAPTEDTSPAETPTSPATSAGSDDHGADSRDLEWALLPGIFSTQETGFGFALFLKECVDLGLKRRIGHEIFQSLPRDSLKNPPRIVR